MLWVAVEWLRCEGWYFAFSWLQLGFTLVSWGGNAALYPLLGVYGVTFLLVLVNVAGAGILQQHGPARWKLVQLLVLFFLIFLPLDFAYWRVINAGMPTPARRALVVQDESSDLSTLRSLTLPEAQGVDLIVWPEYSVIDYPLTNAALLRQMQAVARETGSVLVLGTKEEAPPTARVDGMRRRGMLLSEGKLFYNTALVFAPDGRMLGKYRKTHPIQFFSDGVPGRSYPTIPSPLGRLGLAICYDFDFAGTARTLVQHGAEVLVVPTYDAADWTGVQHAQHARIAQARAAEVGRWVVRATTSGESQVISPLGHLHAQIADGQSRIVKGPFAPRRVLTPYVRWTYRLPLACLGFGLAWLLWLLTIGARPAATPSTPAQQD